MTRDCIIEELKSFVEEGNKQILTTKWKADIIGAQSCVDKALYDGWRIKVLAFLKLFISDRNDFVKAIEEKDKHYYANAKSCISIIEQLLNQIEKGIIDLNTDYKDKDDTITELKKIFSRFHVIARSLRSRHDSRSTIDVKDEYDVQDLLHALLLLFFNDIRAEEWTPSYAGKSARMDFLLKNEKTVIEVKKTRQTLTEKVLGDQLMIDIDRYKVHPDCNKLICFIYDPEGIIGNPSGFMNDLNNRHEGFLEVVIEPNY